MVPQTSEDIIIVTARGPGLWIRERLDPRNLFSPHRNSLRNLDTRIYQWSQDLIPVVKELENLKTNKRLEIGKVQEAASALATVWANLVKFKDLSEPVVDLYNEALEEYRGEDDALFDTSKEALKQYEITKEANFISDWWDRVKGDWMARSLMTREEQARNRERRQEIIALTNETLRLINYIERKVEDLKEARKFVRLGDYYSIVKDISDRQEAYVRDFYPRFSAIFGGQAAREMLDGVEASVKDQVEKDLADNKDTKTNVDIERAQQEGVSDQEAVVDNSNTRDLTPATTDESTEEGEAPFASDENVPGLADAPAAAPDQPVDLTQDELRQRVQQLADEMEESQRAGQPVSPDIEAEFARLQQQVQQENAEDDATIERMKRELQTEQAPATSRSPQEAARTNEKVEDVVSDTAEETTLEESIPTSAAALADEKFEEIKNQLIGERDETWFTTQFKIYYRLLRRALSEEDKSAIAELKKIRARGENAFTRQITDAIHAAYFKGQNPAGAPVVEADESEAIFNQQATEAAAETAKDAPRSINEYLSDEEVKALRKEFSDIKKGTFTKKFKKFLGILLNVYEGDEAAQQQLQAIRDKGGRDFELVQGIQSAYFEDDLLGDLEIIEERAEEGVEDVVEEMSTAPEGAEIDPGEVEGLEQDQGFDFGQLSAVQLATKLLDRDNISFTNEIVDKLLERPEVKSQLPKKRKKEGKEKYRRRLEIEVFRMVKEFSLNALNKKTVSFKGNTRELYEAVENALASFISPEAVSEAPVSEAPVSEAPVGEAPKVGDIDLVNVADYLSQEEYASLVEGFKPEAQPQDSFDRMVRNYLSFFLGSESGNKQAAERYQALVNSDNKLMSAIVDIVQPKILKNIPGKNLSKDDVEAVYRRVITLMKGRFEKLYERDPQLFVNQVKSIYNYYLKSLRGDSEDYERIKNKFKVLADSVEEIYQDVVSPEEASQQPVSVAPQQPAPETAPETAPEQSFEEEGASIEEQFAELLKKQQDPKESVASAMLHYQHSKFFEELNKAASYYQNPNILAVMMLKYSEQIEDQDENTSVKLIRMAQGILNG
jgi:hypothetical protein